ncbi:pyruvate carboxylase [Desulfurispira natronophila]|uniref:Pyruvate carboxylase n=1 Tax=Desulfurispira natronophila TaxID=682562 RepID=A0A7W7Y5Q3_9BACT|nr:pyruvate carboxylase [Desulfurispira natronophila]MBB5022585.1 pyruvate carboxylase [Desulfurispira natronophila]
MTKPIKRILVANRGEIAIRVFRACTELGISTIAIYSKEDLLSLHRYKADEAYLIGEGKGPIEAYLDIDGIISLAKAKDIDAIHPGYGFLAENAEFARKCAENDIKFIGPHADIIDKMGDKVTAKEIAISAGLPVIPGTEKPVKTQQDSLIFAKQHGYPIMIKAAAGGGGRGMRIARNKDELFDNIESAKNEALKAFGNDSVFLEKMLEKPKHIEVQILGDEHGNIVHMYERDCSIQRRHQKVIEVAPCLTISDSQRKAICDDAVLLAKKVGYVNAGTVEFLLDSDGKHYFIEMNPRIQVEHTVTEVVTGWDIVQAQINIAKGLSLDSPLIGIKSQMDIGLHGYAIQCRVTTEDPSNNFMPDTGRITAYRSASGFGVRLDAGNAFEGAEISPHYDSLLVKVTTWGKTLEKAARKMNRSLLEFRIRGVNTNLVFLENVISDPKFRSGETDTTYIESNPDLFQFREKRDRATKTLRFIGDIVVNGTEGIPKGKPAGVTFLPPIVPDTRGMQVMDGTKQILDKQGPEGLAKWMKEQKRLLITDTTMRDAHQSLFATRMRTRDMTRIASACAATMPQMFSYEMWGGATFDVAYRFLKESPWERMQLLRELIPNTLFQMLLRGANAVGYTNYPDNVVRDFIRISAREGMDIYRIFDSLNWLDGMKVAVEEVRKLDKVAEACICYTGDILDKKRSKYDLKYYVNMAKELEKMGAHVLGIKDMAGLLKPYAATELVKALKDNIDIPIHFHTHDTSANAITTVMKAAEAGVDAVDLAMASMAELTSQPSLNAILYALKDTDRDPGIDIDSAQQISNYFEIIRDYYAPFESGLKAGNAEVYEHEIPGGQYSNLRPQAISLGLGERFDDIKKKYAQVNDILGDIVKVTPSSKVVGDLALFMIRNDIETKEQLVERGSKMGFPDSVVSYFKGMMGQPMGGFPGDLQKVVLKGEEAITCRPGELLEPVDLKALQKELTTKFNFPATDVDAISYALYDRVLEDFFKAQDNYGDVSVLDTPTFFYGLDVGEQVEVEIEAGKTLVVKLIDVGEPNEKGMRPVRFELNGVARTIYVKDNEASKNVVSREKADLSNPGHLAASMPGKVFKLLVKEGDSVKKDQALVVTEAMKMETKVSTGKAGKVAKILVLEGEEVDSGDLLVVVE